MKWKDQRLLEAVQSEGIQALDAFYLEHRQDFIRWVHHKYDVGYDEAIDIYQEAIIIMHQNITQGKLTTLEASLKTYLFGIAKNLMLHALRAGERQLRLEKAGDVSEWADATADDPDQDRKKVIAQVLSQLEDPCKSILVLYYYHRMSMANIARLLNYKNEDVVKSQKNRCMRLLRNLVLVQESKMNG